MSFPIPFAGTKRFYGPGAGVSDYVTGLNLGGGFSGRGLLRVGREETTDLCHGPGPAALNAQVIAAPVFGESPNL